MHWSLEIGDKPPWPVRLSLHQIAPSLPLVQLVCRDRRPSKSTTSEYKEVLVVSSAGSCAAVEDGVEGGLEKG